MRRLRYLFKLRVGVLIHPIPHSCSPSYFPHISVDYVKDTGSFLSFLEGLIRSRLLNWALFVLLSGFATVYSTFSAELVWNAGWRPVFLIDCRWCVVRYRLYQSAYKFSIHALVVYRYLLRRKISRLRWRKTVIPNRPRHTRCTCDRSVHVGRGLFGNFAALVLRYFLLLIGDS